MAKFGHIDETSEILEIRTFVVELAEGMVLRDVALAQGLEGFGIVGSYSNQ